MYSLTYKLQPAAVVCNLNRSFAKNSRLRVIRPGNLRYARGDMRGFKNFKGSDSSCPSNHFLFYAQGVTVNTRQL